MQTASRRECAQEQAVRDQWTDRTRKMARLSCETSLTPISFTSRLYFHADVADGLFDPRPPAGGERIKIHAPARALVGPGANAKRTRVPRRIPRPGSHRSHYPATRRYRSFREGWRVSLGCFVP